MTLPLEKDAARLTKIYRRIRDAKAQHVKEAKAKEDELEQQLEQCGKMLLALMDEQQALGLKTTEGTVTKVVKNRYFNLDWPAFDKFVLANGATELFERRLAQRNMAEFIEANPGVAVPGLQVDRRFDVLVRKPSSDKTKE